MLEILALIFLTGKMGDLAVKKGQNKGKWKLFTVLGWFGAEILGIVISIVVFETEGLFSALPLAYGLAIASYFILRAVLNKMPDAEQGFEFEQHPQPPTT